jgi:DNA primase
MTVRDVLDRTDLASVLTELSGEPGRGGLPRWRCCAAEHDDQHPSVTMFRDRRGVERWKCWSGGHGGTAVDAVILARRVSTVEALRMLETRAGISPSTITASGTPRAISDPQTVFSAAARDHATVCAELLWSRAGAAGLRWLRARGLSDDVLRDNLVGFDPGPRILARADGLSRSWGVTYPSFGVGGDMVYLQTRHIGPHAARKYTNPIGAHGPAPAVSHPRGPVADGPLLVTEGVADGLIARTAGYRSAAVLSAAVISPPVADEVIAAAGGEPLIIAFDNDTPGRAAAARLHELVDGRCRVHVLRLGDGLDLTDSYRRTEWTHELTPSGSASTSIS